MSDREDSLVATLRAVPTEHECHREDPDMCCWDTVSYSALAAAVRKWIRAQMPKPFPASRVTTSHQQLYNETLADVARRLGL